MRILIVDDSIEKISELSKFIYEILPAAKIETSENVANAITLLKNNETYNLAIVDLLLPIRNNEDPKNNGGKILIDEIYRISEITPPNYIVGFTQLEESFFEFSKIWSVIRFNYNSTEWKSSLNLILSHILTSNFNVSTTKPVKSQIFVEGLTDKYYLEKTIEYFFSEYSEQVTIVSQKNAGANWVATQIPLWAMKLQKDSQKLYIKSIGLLDSDEAGNKAKKKVDQRNLTENEKHCCSYFQLKANYNKQVVEFYKKGCQIEIEIESLFPSHVLEYAETREWLEHRTPTFIEPPADWKQHEDNSIEYISKKNIPKDALVFLKKVKAENKEDFKKYIENISHNKDIFLNFKPLIEDLFKKIKILK